MLPNPVLREVVLEDYLKVIRKRISLIIVILIIVPTIAAIIVFTTKPIYRATVSIVIEKTQIKITTFEEVTESESYYRDLQYYQTQYKILGSRILAERVFYDLNLSKDPDFQGLRDPIGKLYGSIRVDPIKNSQMVLLHVEDTDPLRAASIANTLAKAYIRQDIEGRGSASKEAAGWLELQLSGIKNKMQESEEALNKYIQENRIVTVPDVEKKTESLLENLKRDRSNFETELAEAGKRYKEKHPRMIALRAQLDDVNKKIEQETDNLLDLNQTLVQYNLLKKDVESNQQLYTAMLTRAKEIGVSEKLEASSIRIVDAATAPDSPFKPKKAQSIYISIFLSLFSGIGLVFFLEYLDSTIRTAEDVSTYVNLPFLGYVPSAGKEAKTDTERSLICFQKPKSVITEAYRSVRTSTLFASPEDKPLKTILITSSLPQEGKTFIASNLACIFCQINERVLLLDIDMRRPRIHKGFNLDQKSGLSNFLTGNLDLSAIIKSTVVPNLSLITSGTIPPNPSELLTSTKMRLLFEDLKFKFDRIILDSPPLLSVADPALLANIVDGVILVIKGGNTRFEAVQRAKNKILEAKGKIIGAIINDIEPEKEDRYYYYYHYYSEEDKKQT